MDVIGAVYRGLSCGGCGGVGSGRSGIGCLVNGKQVQLSLADPRNRRRSRNAAADSGRRDVKASMPGKVIKILVEPGQAVESAAGLLILEAMKMQNEMKAPRAGRVSAIGVKENDSVTAGQMLAIVE